jgi:hypothetical protein
VLLVKLLATDQTRESLLRLLLHVFQDDALCRATGNFLVASLDYPEARQNLRTQSAALVTATVLDEKVRQPLQRPPPPRFYRTMFVNLLLFGVKK